MPKCAQTGGNCSINIEDNKVECKCKGGILYNSETGCIDTETFCKEEVPKCEKTGGKCFVNIEENKVECKCKGGIEYNSETGCLHTENICSEKVPACKKTGGICSVDTENKSATCQCATEGIIYNNETGCLDEENICSQKVPNCKKTKGNCLINIDDKSANCKCTDERITYNNETGCLDSLCSKVCGFSPEVSCEGDLTDEEKIECKCSNRKIFVKGEKVCKDNLCSKVCGSSPEISCEGDLTDEDKIECKCSDNKIFVKGDKACKDIAKICEEDMPLCEKTNGTCSVNVKDVKYITECKCPTGIRYDDLTGCVDIVKICKENVPKCEITKGKCSTNVVDNSVECECPAGKDYDVDTGCANTEKICKEEFPMCENTGGNCSVNVEDKIVAECECPAEILYDAVTGCVNTTIICNEKVPKCEKTGGNCSVNVVGKIDAECECPAEIQYDAVTGCVNTEKICKENVPNCKETGGKCSVKVEENTTQCDCPTGMQYHKETGCAAINETCGEDYPRCEETGGFCKRNSSGKKICQCPHHLQYDENDGCKDLCKSKCGEDPGVKCVGDLSSEDDFNCTCKEEDAQFIPRFQVCKLPCDENKTCENGGSCEKSDDISYCSCMERTSGHFCEIVDDCEHDPHLCGDQNSGAKCVFDAELKKAVCACENELKFDKRYKKCRETCENDGECENGGLCLDSGDDKFCGCLRGTSGHRCEIIDACSTKKCSEDSVCRYDIITRKVFCRCNDTNKIYDVERNKCDEIDNCILKTINNECNKPNEECRDGKCQCKKNYKYSDNNETCEVDICADCPAGSDCDPASDEPCKCTDGYSDGAKCIKYGKCDIGLSKCSQKCDKRTGVCKCDSGFELESDKITCNLKNNTFSCDLDCDPGSCILRNGKKICICPETTYKFKDDRCVDICTLHKGTPPNNPLTCPGKCKGDSSGIQCICEEIYEEAEDGVHCKRKEMCKEERVIEECNKKSALCKEDDNKAGYTCYCDETHEEDEKGICRKKCELAENECLKKNAHCDLDENYNVTCRCPPLLSQKDEDSPCNEIAKFSYIGEMSLLKTKYVIEDDNSRRHKRSTELINSIQLLKDLKEAVKSVYGNNNYKDVKIINCEPSDITLQCKIELQLNFKPSDENALISPEKCNIIQEDYCLVDNLVIKKESRSIFTATDSCIVKDTFCDASTDCESNQGKFKCTCKKGFRTTGSFNPVTTEGNLVQKCEDIDECKTGNHECPKNSTSCDNTYGGYNCICKYGFREVEGKDPKKHGCEAVCDPNPCENDGECEQKRNHEFICRCKPMYTGLTCNETVHAKYVVKVDHKSAAIVGGVLGTLLVIILILVVFFYRRMKRSKNLDSDDEYAQHRQRSVLAEITRLQNKQRNRTEDIERDPHDSNRHARLQRESGEYPKESSEGRMIPRAHTTRSRAEDQDRRDRRSESEMPRRMYGLSSKEDERSRSKMHFSNRAYDEEE